MSDRNDDAASPGEDREGSVTADDAYQAIAGSPDPFCPFTASEVADLLGCSRRVASDRLVRLADRGSLASKRVGARARVFWLPRTRAGDGTEVTLAETLEGTLEPTERLVEYLFETTTAGIALVDTAGELVRANDRMLDLFGTGDWPAVYEALSAVVSSGSDDDPGSFVRQVVERDTPLYDRSGTVGQGETRQPVVVNAAPISDSFGTPVQVLVTVDSPGETPEETRAGLRRLTRITATLRAILTVVVEAPGRRALERRLCHRLVDEGPFELAWVGRVNWVTETVSPVEWAAMSETELAANPVVSEELLSGPTAAVVDTRDVHVVDDVTAPHSEVDSAWRTAALERGFGSAATIPFVYGDRLFGLVTVYSRETGVFGSPAVDGLAGMDGQTDDATVLSELGRAVGHAISALERQQALVNDEFVEVEFRSRALADRFAPVDGVRFVADRAVSLDDGTIVTFASVTGDVAPETYLEGLDGVETVSDARLLGTDDDGFRVSVRTEGQTLPGTLATHGGRTTAVTAAADGLRLTAELPRTAHVQEVKRAAQSVDDDVELVGYRTRAREEPTGTDLRQRVAADLSDRQATALELAHYGGYYAWHRESSLEDLASTMEVSPQTVHEHLRKAEEKLVGAYVDRQTTDGD
jgi:PAS domain-containing protein/predicted DNA-binding protein (UPF0251 family)